MQGLTTANRAAQITQRKNNDQDPEAAQLSIPEGTRVFDIIRAYHTAEGADQIFARAATSLGGTLEAVIPVAGWRAGFPADSQSE